MTTTNRTTVHGIDYIAQVTAELPLNGMELLALISHIQSSAEASIAAIKIANRGGDDSDAADRLIAQIAERADELLIKLHGAYQAVLVALWAERRKDRRYDRSVMPELTPAPKVTR